MLSVYVRVMNVWESQLLVITNIQSDSVRLDWLDFWTDLAPESGYGSVQKKTPTYVFNYNSGISWWIFILFTPVETRINTIQYKYLMT